MIFSLPFGDGVQIKPTDVESSLLVGGLAAIGYGLLTGKTAAALVGAAAFGGTVYRCWEKAVDVQDPELMNGYYLTGGALSATSGDPAEDATLRRMLGIDTRLNRPPSGYGGDGNG